MAVNSRTKRAVTMRKKGATFQQIAVALGVSRARAQQIVSRVIPPGPRRENHDRPVPCERCGTVRMMSPSKYQEYIEQGKRALCMSCSRAVGHSKKRMTVVCPRCGKTRELSPSRFKRLKAGGVCQQCFRKNFGKEVWGLDD